MERKWIKVKSRTKEQEKKVFEGGAYNASMKYDYYSVICVIAVN